MPTYRNEHDHDEILARAGIQAWFAEVVDAVGGVYEAARIVGCTEQAVRYWQSGQRVPSAVVVVMLLPHSPRIIPSIAKLRRDAQVDRIEKRVAAVPPGQSVLMPDADGDGDNIQF